MSRPPLGRLAVAGVLVLAACSSSAEPVPQVVRDYLAALDAGEWSDAYELTALDTYARAPGFALTTEHFTAFHAANPLEGASVAQVVRHDVRERLGGPGVAGFTVDIDLAFSFGTIRTDFYIEGEILPKIEPAFAPLTLTGTTLPTTIRVDGVRTPITGGESSNLTVLPGRHVLTIDGAEVVVLTEPFSVESGPARVVEDGFSTLVLTG